MCYFVASKNVSLYVSLHKHFGRHLLTLLSEVRENLIDENGDKILKRLEICVIKGHLIMNRKIN